MNYQMENQESFKTKLDASEYFDIMINKIDIDTEQSIIDMNNSKYSIGYKPIITNINRLRGELIDEAQTIKNAILDNFHNHQLLVENQFGFYLEKESINCFIKNPRLGILVLTNSFISSEKVESFKEYLFHTKSRMILKSEALQYNPVTLDQELLNYMFIEQQIKDQTSTGAIHVARINNDKNIITNIIINKHSIEKIHPDTFDGCFNLKSLNLSNDNIKTFDSALQKLTNLTMLSLESNLIETINNSMFSRLVNLKVLNLSANKISSIEKFAFKDMIKLEKLILSRNSVSSLNGSLFQRCKELKLLDLSDNVITQIQKDDFKGLSSLESLLINSFSRNIMIKDNAFIGLSKLRVLFITKLINLTKNTFSGLHSLEHLRITNILANNLPDECFINLQNLKTLELPFISRVYMPHFTDKSFSGLDNLTELSLEHFHYRQNFDKPFSRLKNLKNLIIENSYINQDFNDFLMGLENLQVLNLNSVQLRSKTLFGYFNDMQMLRKLKMPSFLSNGTEKLKKHYLKLLSRLNNLQELSFYHHHDQIIDNLPNYSQIDTLTMSGMIVKSIGSSFTSKLSFVKHLSIIENEIDVIETDCFKDMICLEELVLYENNIKIIKEFAFRGLVRLQKLNLHNNYMLESIDRNAFPECLKQLKFLNLNNTNLHVIDCLLLRNLSGLEALMIGYNNFETIDSETFRNLNSLKTLMCSDNGIQAISRDLFRTLIKIEDLDLSYNQIEIIDSETFLDLVNLKKINLSRNLIKNLDLNVFRNCTNLEVLKVYENSIESIDFEPLKRLENIKKIEFQGNSFKSMNEHFLERLIPSIECYDMSEGELDKKFIRPPLFNYMGFS